MDWVMLEPDFTGPDGSSLWLPGWALERGQLPVGETLRRDIEQWRLEWERECYFNDDEWLDAGVAARWRAQGYALLARLNEELAPHEVLALPAFDDATGSPVTSELRKRFRDARPPSDAELAALATAISHWVAAMWAP